MQSIENCGPLTQSTAVRSKKTNMVTVVLSSAHNACIDGKTSDAWRNFQLLKASGNPNHPFAKFGCGNYETLSKNGLDSLLEELESFWQKYYQTYNLRLAVVGHGSLDSLQETVMETFGQIPSSNKAPRHMSRRLDQFFTKENAVYGVPAFGPDQLGLYRRVLPFTETRKLKISFATPPLEDPRFQQSRPYRALSHFLGHEAPGSLHAVLNEEGLINGLSSGISIETSDFSLFTVTLGLTPKGMGEIDSILDLFFQWLALLKQQSDEQLNAYHDELRQLSANSFRFRENSDPTEFCSAVSEMLFTENLVPSNILRFSSESGDYNSEIAQQFLDRLVPENCFVQIVSSDFAEEAVDWKEEKWYGAKYDERVLDDETSERWRNPPCIDKRLEVPGFNKYIATDFSLRCDDSDAKSSASFDSPSILVNTPKLRLWHKLDRTWRVPKTFIKISLLSPSMYETPRAMTLNRIFQRVLNDDLNSYVYDASVAGCNYKLSTFPTGFRLSVEGYSEKLPFLLDTLASRIFSLIDELKGDDEVLRLKFEKAKEALLRETKNYRLDAPYEVNNYNSRLLLEEKVWYLEDYLSLLEGANAEQHPLTMQECAETALKCLTRVKCEALCMGNINESEALRVCETLESNFFQTQSPLRDSELPTLRSMRLPTKYELSTFVGGVVERSLPLAYQELSFSESEENNAVEVFFQVDSELELGYRGVALLELIAHLASTSSFNVLRTNEQLGYIVGSHGRRTLGGGWGLSVVVQGSVALPDRLEERIEAWLVSFRKELNDMEDKSISSEAKAVAAQFLEKVTKLSQEVDRAWGEILATGNLADSRLGQPCFDRISLLASELLLLADSPDELRKSVLSMFDKYFSAASEDRRSLSARVFRQSNRTAYEESRSQPGIFSSHSDIRYVKHFLGTLPNVPYWTIAAK